MVDRTIMSERIQFFNQYLIQEEKSTATVEKYLLDVRAFCMFLGLNQVSNVIVIAYKKYLLSRGYAVCSINSMLASQNCLLGFLGWSDCKVKAIKQQKQVYCAEDTELDRTEYMRLLEAANKKRQL